ncbi:HutD family protein [Enterococcus sp. BWT-B8]|uniref:HutD family protein n=1 Tax=Enterococcus sp. BWT-B8 TaxID=2885157 RepID=UPI001E5109EF|nr:HutD family protein [Enterococcus sp. BWT-B8]MCB5952389.1 HutD family protein [Enterococcus sp. BWT-B8]
MGICRLTSKEYHVSDWSGGKTTEIYLSPPEGQYQIGKFDYRVSSARVDLETTTFSELPGYKRLIMPIEQSLTLEHVYPVDTVERVILQPFESHCFDGGQKTTSYGKCRDFNLIYRPEYFGEMIALMKEQPYFIEPGKTYLFYALTDVLVEIFEKNECISSLQLCGEESILFSEHTFQLLLAAIPKKRTHREPLAIWTTIARMSE